jgi:hypothetical protein
MAFQKASGYNNLPNGVFSPTLYSKKVQKAFRKSSVVEGITNSDYFGEISNFGDSVRIIKEPEITVQEYARGTQITPQDMEDEDFSLVVDKANYFAFKVDDIEEKHSHVNWMDMATDRAGYKMKDTYDSEILGYMSGYVKNSSGVWVANTTTSGSVANTSAGTDEWLAERQLDRSDFVSGGTSGHAVSIGTRGTVATDYDATPLRVLNRMNRFLDLHNVPQEGRWVVVDPIFLEILRDEDSKFMNHDYQTSEALTNGQVVAGKIRGFKVYESNNLPFLGTGAGTADGAGGNTTNFGVVVAGHDSAVATASQITKTESYRDPDSFADIVRGMQLYGRKILRPESLVRVIWNIGLQN